jgi:glutathione synthase/RimK-type ligase-like ATP-grasp enzyme
VPLTAVLTPDLKLDPANWGEFVIVKPTDLSTSSRGHGFMLMRTARVRYIAPRDYPAGHPGRNGPMMVQQYVNDDGHVGVVRVLTLFGEPLYAVKNRSIERIVDPNAPDEVIEALPVAHQSLTEATRVRTLAATPEELTLARAAHNAMPEIPLKGIDILRDGKTGRLYVIELNCRGNTWHFSSAFEAGNRARNGEEFERRRRSQFDALRTTARVLVARTNAEAL